MLRTEYLRFLQTLTAETEPEGVCKIANIVLAHLDALIPLTTYQGHRVKRMIALAQTNWDTTSEAIQPLPATTVEQSPKLKQLKSLSVGPFRGFARQETFDLASRIVLIYGPNGTGKSSFCEALEYALLGNVAEAESKRFPDQHEYLKNAHANQLRRPKITAQDEQGNEVSVTPSEALYRFCFVEKNRIESFSRIAAQAPAKQTELISTLFGLESFSELVRNFTPEIDGKYIDLVGEKAKILAQKREALIGQEYRIKASTAELQIIAREEEQLTNQYDKNTTFSQIIFELHGAEEIPGKISRLEAELQQPASVKSNLTSAALETLGNRIATNVAAFEVKQQELAAASQQVSFKNLYEAISQVQQSSSEECPACKTPINQTSENPYTHAREELKKLQQLASLEQAAQQLNKTIQHSLFDCLQMINTCLRNHSQNNSLEAYQIINNTQPDIAWWNALHQSLPDGLTPWQQLASQVKQLENADIQMEQADKIRTNKQAELSRLREVARQITVLQARKETANTAIISAQKLIDSFYTENAQMIADTESEKAIVLRNQDIASCYTTFVEKLNTYSDSLPAKLIENLSEIVVTLYNAFNRNDSANELLANVKLPLAQHQRLEIAFQTDPNKFHDALHILSEGHIRCLGLAILLSKNLKENMPLLIFDDPVNAIDDDHRESIRKTLFEDHYFSEKQILLTCHGEEFLKDISNSLPAQAAKQPKSFTFLPRQDESHIQINFNCPPRNYILAARNHIDLIEKRDALSKSRQALESLTKGKIWNYVGKHSDGILTLRLRSIKAPVELRNLTEQLKRKIAENDFGDPNKSLILTPLNALLGLDGNSREWHYLNKGTHEESDRAEFDRHTVQTIVSNLEKLDEALE